MKSGWYGMGRRGVVAGLAMGLVAGLGSMWGQSVGSGAANSGGASSGGSSGGTVQDPARAARALELQSRYLTPVKAEWATKLDTKTATVGQVLALKTDVAATLADGTVIPEGTKLMGRVLGVRAKSAEHAGSTVLVIFDKAELKGGKVIPVRCMIRTVGGLNTLQGVGGDRPGAEGMGIEDTALAGAIGAQQQPGAGGRGGTAGGTAGGTNTGRAGGSAGTSGSSYPGTTTYPGTTRRDMPATVGSIAGGDTGETVRMTAQGGETVRNAPQPTGLPGVMLETNPGSDVSGMLIGSGQNVKLDNGTQITLGVILR